MRIFQTSAFVLLLTFMIFGCKNQDKPVETLYEYPFQNPALSPDERAEDLVARLTREEKVGQLFNQAPAIERLGIPAYNWWNEALHGVARAGKATVFPQAIGMAATFNEALMHQIGTVISDEGRAKHHYFVNNGISSIYTGLTFWSPNINIFRDPRWGRGQETYGEDPWLTGRMAVNFINGLQGDDPKYLKTIATAKHYAVHSGPEATRHSDNFYSNDRDLYQTYLPAFEMAVKEANVQSVMCAYNRFREMPCCGSDLLLQRILRQKFGFDGYIVSDCGAITDFYKQENHGLVDRPAEAWGWALSAGTDLNCEEDKAFINDNLIEAFEQGIMNEADLNTSLKRLFRARFALGMFDPPALVPFSQIPIESVGNKEHLQTALEAAQQSLVLLKNSGILPLKPGVKVALIGPNADNEDVLVGNYNGVPMAPTTPLRALRERLGAENVLYSPGSPLVPKLYGHIKPVPASCFFHEGDNGLEPGLKASYFTGADFQGEAAISRVDSAVNFNWEVSPISGKLEEIFCAKWEGVFIPEKTGTYIFNGTADLKLDGRTILDQKFGYIEYDEIRLEKGKKYKMESKFIKQPHWWSNLLYPSANLVWAETSTSHDYKNEALAIAAQADVVVFCGGISPRLEGEEMKVETEGFAHGDRTNIELPKVQQELIMKLHATGKPVIYINFSGSAIALNWQDENLPAIVQAFYPGEAAGTAIVGLLFGDFSPSGKLPITFYKSISDLPDFAEYQMKGRTYRYFTGEPLYPFGFGLSYTTFEYSDMQMPEKSMTGISVPLSVTVKNTGSYDGYTVVQVYLSDVESTVPVPLKSLVGFKKVFLAKGESQTLTFEITPKQLSVIDNDLKRVIEPGVFRIMVGDQSAMNERAASGQQGQILLEGEVVDMEL